MGKKESTDRHLNQACPPSVTPSLRSSPEPPSKRCPHCRKWICGRANGVITPEFALKVGQATGLVFQPRRLPPSRRHRQGHPALRLHDRDRAGRRLHLGRHGRAAARSDAEPAVAMLTRSMRADLGVMISASHNPYDDNGIKLFGPDGYKLSRRGRATYSRL